MTTATPAHTAATATPAELFSGCRPLDAELLSVEARLEMIGDPHEELAILLYAADDELKAIEAARRSAADEFDRQLKANAASRQAAEDGYVVNIADRQQMRATRAELLASGANPAAVKLQDEHLRAIEAAQPANLPRLRRILEGASPELIREALANGDTAAAALARYRDSLAGQLIRCQAQLTGMESLAQPSAAD